MPSKKFLKPLGLLLLAAVLTPFLLKNSDPSRTSQTTVPLERAKPAAQFDHFGFNLTEYQIEDKHIERNQTFSQILSEHGVETETINKAVEQAGSVFDVRRIRAGKAYRIYRQGSTVRHLVYQEDAIRYYVFDLQGAPRVSEKERPVMVQEKTVSATITSSLYGALAERKVDPALASKLAEVFAWQIDFYHLQKGDNFTLVYQEQKVENEPVGVGSIVSARFEHAGEEFYAFYFEQGDESGYFDENGNSLRQAFLKSPLKYGTITSHYSLKRFHPVQKRYKAHLGTDYAAPSGTEIYSVGDGVVLEAAFQRYNGNYVKVRHNGAYTTGYLHMSRIAKGIKPGTHVKQGEVIGYVGSTGLATGPHVCFRFWKDGNQVDPLKEKMPPSEPVKGENRFAFLTLRDELLPRLQLPASLPLLAELTLTRDSEYF